MGNPCVMCGYIQPKGPHWYELECPRCGADYVTGKVSPHSLESTAVARSATAATGDSLGKRLVLWVAPLAPMLVALSILALALVALMSLRR